MDSEDVGIEPKLALMCLYPDWGHVKPLLSIALAAAQSGFDVRFFVPAATSRLIHSHGFATTEVDVDPGEDMAKLFRHLSRKSAFFLNFSGYSHTNLLIYPNILHQIFRNLDFIEEEFRKFSPDLVIGDSHLFRPVYEHFSKISQTPILINDASGTLAGRLRIFDRSFGLKPNLPGFAKTVVEAAGTLHEFFYRRMFYLYHWRRYLDTRDIKAKLSKALTDGSAQSPSSPIARGELTLGLGWVELELLETKGPVGDDKKAYFPPVITSSEKISEDLKKWMKSKDGIIYISFGSIISLTLNDMEGIIRSLRDTGRPIIWSTSKFDLNIIKSLIGDDGLFFTTAYVAQATLLHDPRIALFVTHAGANSVQEALLAGTPTVCVPFYADALYIASLVERLGTGIAVSKRRLRSKNSLADAIRHVIQDSSYAKRATEVSAHIRAGSAASQLGPFLRGQSRPRASSRAEMESA